VNITFDNRRKPWRKGERRVEDFKEKKRDIRGTVGTASAFAYQ